MRANIAKWGNSLALRLPRSIAADVRLEEGTPVDLVVEAGGLVIRPSPPTWSLADLVAGITLANRHAETDWSAPRGREVW